MLIRDKLMIRLNKMKFLYIFKFQIKYNQYKLIFFN